MTKKHFIRKADIVRAILAGEWTNEPPAWSPTYGSTAWQGHTEDYASVEFDGETYWIRS